MVKRYAELPTYDCEGEPNFDALYPSDSGEWCKYSEVEPLLRELRELEEDMMTELSMKSLYIRTLQELKKENEALRCCGNCKHGTPMDICMRCIHWYDRPDWVIERFVIDRNNWEAKINE